MRQSVVIVGPMGVGKSTTGKLLAKELNCEFFDMDAEIEARTGASIPLIFEMEGEQGFRNREQKILDELLSQKSCVVATGGGVVMREKNREWLRTRCFVIYLSANEEQLYSRLKNDKKRPLLQTGDKKQKIEALIKARAALYDHVADSTVEVSDDSPKKVVNQMLEALHQFEVNQ